MGDIPRGKILCRKHGPRRVRAGIPTPNPLALPHRCGPISLKTLPDEPLKSSPLARSAPPVKAGAGTARASSDSSAEPQGIERAGNSSGKVLVVADPLDFRREIAELLSTRFEVITAGDGIAALAVTQEARPDLVLSEVLLPKLDGVALLKAIRARPDLHTLPVILLADPGGEDAQIAGLDAGADDYLLKPVRARELLARVNVHLHLARMRGQAQERERELRTNAELFARALRESNERLSASLLAAHTGTFRWDLRTNAVDADDALERLFGLPPGEHLLALADLVQRIHPDDRARALAACERSARTGADYEMEFRLLLPDGSVRWLGASAKAAFDNDGQPEHMTGACVDLTRRKRVETFIWRQKDVLEQIIEGAALPDVLEALTLDIEHASERRVIATVMIVEPGGNRLRMVAGRRCPPSWAQAIDGLEIAADAISCGTAAFLKERITVRDVNASPLWETYRTEAVRLGLRACTSTPILSSGGAVLGTFALYHPEPAAPSEDQLRYVDIVTRTAAILIERDRAQRALRESQEQLAHHAQMLEHRVSERTAELQETISELESFSYSISHDMRAPLRAMQSFAQILAEEYGGQIGPEGKDYIRRIITASDRMDRLIQDVLIYSRVTRTELKLEPVILEKLLDGILESYPQFQAPTALVEIQRPLPVVMANEAALTQCLSNLLGNAVKFVSPGITPHVRIWAEVRDGRARVLVRDNGIGIEQDAHEKIFHIFQQLDRSYEGTGIGLSIVRKAAERMGGSVGVHSRLGRGSTFHLELNLAQHSNHRA